MSAPITESVETENNRVGIISSVNDIKCCVDVLYFPFPVSCIKRMHKDKIIGNLFCINRIINKSQLKSACQNYANLNNLKTIQNLS